MLLMFVEQIGMGVAFINKAVLGPSAGLVGFVT